MTINHSAYLYGIHDANGLEYPGWEIRTEGIGHDPENRGGVNYRDTSHTVISRLNNGYGGAGTIPLPQFYDDFARRMRNFVEMSVGCDIWIVGNEMNHSQERPEKQPITPELYGQCYSKCREQIHSLPGHENDQVIVGAVAPYNNETKYTGNLDGNWIVYFQDVLEACGEVDGIALHTYSSSQQQNIIISDAKMGAPFEKLSSEFRAYQDFMNAVPERLRHTRFYITEANPGARGTPWKNENTRWVQAAYDEIVRWNEGHYGQEIRCLALYCWDTRGDGMYINDKPGVHKDFYQAVERGLTWRPEPPIEPPIPPEPPVEPPAECQFSEDVLRKVLKEELALLYENLRDAMQEEIRRQLDKTVLKAQ